MEVYRLFTFCKMVVISGWRSSRAFTKCFLAVNTGVPVTSTTITSPVEKPRFTSTWRKKPRPVVSSKAVSLKSFSSFRTETMIRSAVSSSVWQESMGTIRWVLDWYTPLTILPCHLSKLKAAWTLFR